MNERPILFSTPMVKAILEGRKTMTRRVVNCPHEIIRTATPEEWNAGKAHPKMVDYEEWHDKNRYHLLQIASGSIIAMQCPFGIPGDSLWVRETFWIDEGDSQPFYKASEEHPEIFKWKPSLFMPRWASRTTLEITNVRVERLQEITEEDAEREGIERVGGKYSCCPWRNYLIRKPGEMKLHCSAPSRSFQTLWDSINGKKYPWSSNPFVWVIEFKRLEAA